MAARSAREKSGKASGAKALQEKAQTQTDIERVASMGKVLAHPTRLQILAIAHQRPISPSEFAKAHGKPTSTISHHFKKLREYGAIKLVKREPVQGSVRNMYVGTKRAIYTESEWPTFPEAIKTGLATATLEDFIVVTARAIETGKFTGREDFVFTWDEAQLDELAWKKLGKMLRLVWKKVPSLEEESDVRKERSGDEGMTAIVGLAAYEAAPETETSKKSGRKPARKKKRAKGKRGK